MTIHELLERKEFSEAVQYSLEKIIKLLLMEDVAFYILTNVEHVSFEPNLPKEISNNFKPITMFELYGYTLSSASLKNGILSFEAGFGEDNFAAFVKVPLFALLQIAVENTPIFINMSIPKLEDLEEEMVEKKEDNQNRSMKAFLNNPENKDIIKK